MRERHGDMPREQADQRWDQDWTKAQWWDPLVARRGCFPAVGPKMWARSGPHGFHMTCGHPGPNMTSWFRISNETRQLRSTFYSKKGGPSSKTGFAAAYTLVCCYSIAAFLVFLGDSIHAQRIVYCLWASLSVFHGGGISGR